MILTERTINIIDHESIMDSPVVLYRGDKNVELKLNIKSSRFKFRDDDSSNFIESAQASYGQLIIQTPNQNEPIFSEITATKKGYIIFVITAEMIDEIDEVGAYTFQVRLLDSNKRSRATIPPVVNGIEIREPITSEDSNVLNSAVVGLASAANEEVLDTFDEHGDYAKTNWKFGDKITAAKLNKAEDGIYQSYALGINNSSQIKDIANKTADKNDLQSVQQQVNNLVLGAVGDGNNAEVVQARSSYKTLNDRLDNMVNKWEQKNIVWQDGKYVNMAGVIIPLSNYSISQSFSTEGLDIVKLNNVNGNDRVSTITFFPTDSDTIAPTPTVISTDTETFTVEVPSNAKRFILCKPNSNVTFSCYSNGKIKYNYTDISANIKWNDGYYIDNSGNFSLNADYSYSDFIELSEGTIIKGLPNSNFPCVAYYDKHGNYLNGISKLVEHTTSSSSGDEYYIRIVKCTSTGCPIVKIPNKNLFKGITNHIVEENCTDISDNISYVSGYIDSTGQLITPFEGFTVSSILKVVDNINISNISPNTTFPNVAFYDKKNEIYRGHIKC